MSRTQAMLENFRAWPGHIRLVAGTLLGTILLLLLLVTLRGVSWYLQGSERLAYTEPRYARLQGFIHSVDTLRVSSAEVAASLRDLSYPAEDDLAATGASAQQHLRRLLEGAGMDVSGSQVLAPEEHEGYLEIRLDLEANGSMEALEQALLALREARPLVFVRSLDLTPQHNRRRNAPEIQNVALSLKASVVKLQ